MCKPPRFTYISHRPYMRADRQADKLQTFVINPLIHADRQVGLCQARGSQLIPVSDFSEFPDAILLKKPKCFTVSGPVSRPFRRCHSPA